MKVMVTGANGQLGYDVVNELANRHILHKGVDNGSFDITDKDAVFSAIDEYRPSVVIHCAAYTAVDRAEDEPDLCKEVNEEGTRNIALACKQVGAAMLYISTDYVFPGVGNHFHRTDCPTGPSSVYGATKLSGEKAVMEVLQQAYIVRISWVFGQNGNNFVKTMLKIGKERQIINVVCDQIGSPTYCVDVASLLCDIIASDKYGIYHATNEGICSWSEFAEEIFRLCEMDVKVNHITSSEYPTKAIRPLNSRLDKSCLDNAGFSRLPHWKDALNRYLQTLRDKKHEAI